MHSQFDEKRESESTAAQGADAVRRLQAYLDSVSVGLPRAERQAWREEATQHLESMIAAYEELGSDHEEAVELALRHFGDPSTLQPRLRREAWQAAARRTLYRDLGRRGRIAAVYAAAVTITTVAMWNAQSRTASPVPAHGYGPDIYLAPIAILCGGWCGRVLAGRLRPAQSVAGPRKGVRRALAALASLVTVGATFCLTTRCDSWLASALLLLLWTGSVALRTYLNPAGQICAGETAPAG